MCDCYEHPCEGCGVKIPVHIGDWSLSRDHLHVFCHRPKCREKALRMLVGKDQLMVNEEQETNFIVMAKPWYSDKKGYHKGKPPYRGANPNKTVLFIIEPPSNIDINWC